MHLSNPIQSEAIHNISAHQLPQYHQPQDIPSMAWTALVTWSTCHKLVHIKVFQNLCLLLFVMTFWYILKIKYISTFFTNKFNILSVNLCNHCSWMRFYFSQCKIQNKRITRIKHLSNSIWDISRNNFTIKMHWTMTFIMKMHWTVIFQKKMH